MKISNDDKHLIHKNRNFSETFSLKPNKRKSAQAEAFGLILVVALIFVVIVIMAKIEQNRTPTDIKKNYELNELSSSTINTLFSTVVNECRGKTFSELLVDCIKNPDSMCDYESSCEHFISETRQILSIVFGEERVNFDYRLTIESDRALPLIIAEPIKKGSCGESLRGEDFILPLNPGTLTLSLVVCGS